MNRGWLVVALLVAAGNASAQSSAAKKELVGRLLEIQQPGLEALARGLVEQPAAMLLQQAGPILQNRVPAERREAAGKSIDSSTKRYFDEATPLVRDRAIKLAPSTIGAALEAKLSEDELRQLIAWFESPLNKKYQQMMPVAQADFTKALVADARPAMESKLKSLEQGIGSALGITTEVPAEPESRPAAKPHAKGRSK